MNNKETLNTYNGRLSTNNDTITNINSLLKRLPVGGEDLTEELTDYETNLTTQETSIQDIIEALEGKATGGGGGKYAPRFVSFRNYVGTDLNEELANLDTSKVTSMYGMFNSCANFTELDLGSLDTSKVTNMYAMFGGCKSLVDLDLSNFDTSNVTDMGYMFSGCSKLENLDIRNFDFSNVTNYTNMFGNTETYVPIYCVIIVKDDTAKEWVYAVRNFPNIKTVAELEG